MPLPHAASTGRGPGSVRRRGDAAGGFTLIEVLLVLLIAGLLAGAVGASLYGTLASARAREAVRDVAAHLRHAQGQAVLRREPLRVEFDLEQRRYRVGEGTPVELPEAMEIELHTAAEEVVSGQVGAIRFLPGGGSTGGRVLLQHEGRTWTITVSWLTGLVELHEGGVGDGEA